MLEEWLNQRGINPEQATGIHGVSLTNRGGNPAVVFPFVQNGEVVNNKYRTLADKQFSQDANAVKCFWNVDVITDKSLTDQPLIITEGEIDALSFIQNGHPRTISVPDGAPSEALGDEVSLKYSYLEDVIADIRSNCPYVILALDDDKPGHNLMHDLALRIGKDFCKYVKYPKGCKDANEALVKYGRGAIPAIIDTAEWLDIDGVFTLETLPPVAEATVYSIDMPGFNDHMKVRLGDFTIVTGIPGMGKTTFVNDITARLATKYGLNSVFASFEQHPTTDHIPTLLKMGKATQGASNAREWLSKHFSFIYPSDKQQLEETIDLDWFLEKASAAILQHGAKIVILDPWNEIEHSRNNNETTTEYVGRSIKRLKHFAKANNIHLIVVAHPAKMYRDKAGVFPMPSLYDISDSAHWANKADLGIVVHRENYDTGETIICNRKSRYHQIIGRPGQASFRLNTTSMRFEWCDVE